LPSPALTRFTGYAGATNLLGDRLLSDTEALAPILTTLSRRGLYFYDGGSTSQSMAPQVAGSLSAPFAQGSAQIDTIQTALEIDRRFPTRKARLAPMAAPWAKGLQARGFVLVPVSAIVSAPKQ
jgi:polysaccharide deacetylase 2 family uncharacterized protein YibQ